MYLQLSFGFHDAAVNGILQKHTNQFIAAPAGLCRNGVDALYNIFFYPDGKDSISIVTLCPFGVDYQFIVLQFDHLSGSIICFQKDDLYVIIYVIKYTEENEYDR